MPQSASEVEQPDRRPRDRYVDEVCPALRGSLLHAIDHGRHPHKTRVLLAVLYLTAGWSRCSDWVYAGQIAGLVKIPGDAGERKTRAFLREIANEGTIEWDGARGRARRSRIGLRATSVPNRPLLGVVPESENRPSRGSERDRLTVGKPAVSRAPTEGFRGVQDQADQRGVSRAREGRDLAALPHENSMEAPDELAAGILAGVARRRQALEMHGPLARLLALLPDADENTPKTLHAFFDPLGDDAVEVAIRELESYGSEVRRPSAYVVGIAKRLGSRQRSRGRRSGAEDLARIREEDAEAWERIEAATRAEDGGAS